MNNKSKNQKGFTQHHFQGVRLGLNFRESKSGAGFTLIEVIIAIAILVIGIVGIYSVFSRILTLTSGISDKLVAAYLAQEGIEIVRNIRDTNWIEGVSWNDGLGVGDWEADYAAGSLNDDYDGDFLNIGGTGFYNYSSGTPTKFRRKITIEQIDTYTLKVTAWIGWEEKGNPYNFEVEEYIYDWY